jgi:hypothetical protein
MGDSSPFRRVDSPVRGECRLRLQNGRWVPTFPNARYVFSDRELAYWTERNAQNRIDCIVDSVLPIVAANRAELVRSDQPQRSCPIAADARAYARPFRRAPRQVTSRRRRDRRSYTHLCRPAIPNSRANPTTIGSKPPGPAVHFWNGSVTAEHCAARPIFHRRRWAISPGGATDFAARPSRTSRDR